MANLVARALGIPMGILIGAIAFSCHAAAQDMRNMSILTGAEGGTYYRFGNDIGAVVRKICTADLEVRDSQGSIDNLGRLRSEPLAQLAIVQQDVLDYVRLNRDRHPAIQNWVASFKYVHPLYREEVHIVARRDAGVRTLADLAGKRVAVGEPRSGTNLTATIILDRANLRGRLKEVEVGARDAILGLLGLQGGALVDAAFYVAGQPVPLLSRADPQITDKHLAQLTLVAIPKNPAPNLYAPAQLTQETYPWLDRTVDTVSVRAVLITYDFKGPQCDNVAMAARLITDHLDDLRRFGHEKWRDVDLGAQVDGWARYACVQNRVSTPIAACRFRDADEAPSASCRRVCDPRGNALECLFCQDKAELLNRRR
ncbi:MAG TPA: TAXI family TRAP transporter solute-binding subunit [Hyphomicrobiaceae bacterium]|jgi:TRAP transporter TAXI family solute receptor|nr:TAXI family TRAP transporter solute-binding subunit [Hyphomicrobiaceae bacterium]